MSRAIYRCYEPAQAHKVLTSVVWPEVKAQTMAGRRMVVEVRPETRSLEQNRLMWPLLTAFSEQLEWPVNGCMTKLTPDEFKDVLSAGFHGEAVRLAMGLNGGVVMLGQHTSKFTKPQFTEWIEFLYATAADRGVRLPAWEVECAA